MAKANVLPFGRSVELLQKSRNHLAGGVSSQFRSTCKPVPLFFRSGSGSRLIDADGNHYIDFTLAWGPLILGHSHPAIVSQVARQLNALQLVGAQHELEISVSEKICQMVPSAELVAFSSTGSEAVQVALRLARTFSERSGIIRFEGHYHGWLDNMLIGYRPGRRATPGRKGPAPSTDDGNRAHDQIYALPWNDVGQLEATLSEHGGEIGAIITEPVLCNCHCLMPLPGYLEGMRELATRYGVVLIFDETITGFRVARGGAQELFGVMPDLTVFGKAVAGGFPLSVIAGKREIMDLIAQGRVVHAGTFNGNPISLAAAQATLDILAANSGAVLQGIRKTGESLIQGIRELAKQDDIPLLVHGVGSVFHLAFTTRQEMHDYQDTLDSDMEARDHFIAGMLHAGVYLLPDGRWYVSSAHQEAEVQAALDAVQSVFQTQKNELLPSIND